MTREKHQLMYILRNGGTNQYKIGITKDLNRRLSELQTGCPEELRVVKIYTHYQRKIIQRYETLLHRHYTKQGKRIRNNGEWYRLTEEDIRELCEPQSTQEQNKLVYGFAKADKRG